MCGEHLLGHHRRGVRFAGTTDCEDPEGSADRVERQGEIFRELQDTLRHAIASNGVETFRPTSIGAIL